MDYKEMMYTIVGAAMEVHSELHHELTEAVYQEALEYEFKDRNIEYAREVRVPIQYKEHTLNKYYQIDFVCFNDIILELKSVTAITTEHRYQLFTYMRLTKKPYGLLLNFGEKSLHIERYRLDSATGNCVGFAS